MAGSGFWLDLALLMPSETGHTPSQRLRGARDDGGGRAESGLDASRRVYRYGPKGICEVMPGLN